MIAMLAERRCKVNVRWDEAMWNGREVLEPRRKRMQPPQARAASCQGLLMKSLGVPVSYQG
jgi:hypothetical protein